MKRRLILFLFLICCCHSFTMAEKLVLKECSFLGRVDNAYKGKVIFSYPGVSVKLKFKGSSKISVLMADTLRSIPEQSNYFYLFIDGKLKGKIQPSTQMQPIVLADGLSKSEHTVELIKLTESQVGTTIFNGFLLDVRSKVLKSDYSADLNVEFIGNSITCGYGNEVASFPPKSGFESINQNNYFAWGAIVARKLSANYQCVAYSGRGLRRNFSGDSLGTLPLIYNRVLPDDDDSHWNFKNYTPNLLVINLGTNDFSAETNLGLTVDSVEFVSSYLKFVKQLRDFYPQATIVCVVGPMMSDDYPKDGMQWSRIQRYVGSVVSSSNKAGDSNIYYFAHDPQLPPFGEDYHPSKSTHERMADRFVSFLQTLGY